MNDFSIIDGLEIEYRLIEPEDQGEDRKTHTLVFLHEGLGSTKMWKQFPDDICHDNKIKGLVFSRPGYGWSDYKKTPLDNEFMHYQANEFLPSLLIKLGVENPLLIGHSDGASIALIAASQNKKQPVGVVAMAPHVIVEDKTISSIQLFQENFHKKNIADKLCRYHKNPDAMFSRWVKIWLDPAFRNWSLVGNLKKIKAPLLIIQGKDDIYGTQKQLDIIKNNTQTHLNIEVLSDCGHSPQFEQPDLTRQLITKFIRHIIN